MSYVFCKDLSRKGVAAVSAIVWKVIVLSHDMLLCFSKVQDILIESIFSTLAEKREIYDNYGKAGLKGDGKLGGHTKKILLFE